MLFRSGSFQTFYKIIPTYIFHDRNANYARISFKTINVLNKVSLTITKTIPPNAKESFYLFLLT